MKVNAFKKLIMEAAKEGVKQAFIEMQEEKQPLQENFSFNNSNMNSANMGNVRKNIMEKVGMLYNEGSKTKNLEPVAGDNPYLAFLQDTAQNISPQDRQAVGNLGETY